MKTFIEDYKRWGLSVAWWNLRFDLGMKVGGFTSARRSQR